MGLLDKAIESQLHWETAVAILDGALTWGAASRVAARAGISREYLSRLRKGEVRPPSTETADAIACSLPLPAEQAQDLLDHFSRARESFESFGTAITNQEKSWLRVDALGELTRAHWLATYSKSPAEARTYYRAVLRLGDHLVRGFSQLRYALGLARVHTLMQDALCVLNRPGAGLYHAKVARGLTEMASPEGERGGSSLSYYDFRSRQEALIPYGDVYVNAIRIEAACHNMLGDHAHADLICDQALRTEAARHRPDIWLPHVLRDKLNALARNPRTPLEDVEACGRWGRSVCEARGDGLGLLLIENGLARGYALRRRDADALRILEEQLERAEGSEDFGQLHKAMLYENLAELHRWRKEWPEWRHRLTRGLALAREGGLAQVHDRLVRTHGDHPAFGEIREAACGVGVQRLSSPLPLHVSS